MGLVVIVDELGDGGVVTTAKHARRSGLGLDCGVLVGVEAPEIWIDLHFFS